jgi:predicted small secreted protein
LPLALSFIPALSQDFVELRLHSSSFLDKPKPVVVVEEAKPEEDGIKGSWVYMDDEGTHSNPNSKR